MHVTLRIDQEQRNEVPCHHPMCYLYLQRTTIW